jgi:L-ascorbate metabolism protein UlaG (beta-lactamase superfamily)
MINWFKLNKVKFFFISFLIITVGYLISCNAKKEISYMQNPKLKTILPNHNWKGNPKNHRGEFENLYHPFKGSLWDVIKWQLSKNPQKKEKKNEERRLVSKPNLKTLYSEDDYLISLGHASFLLKLEGKTILIDPILFENFFLKRESEFPFTPEQLPKIDYLLISHNHRDHCDKKSIEFLAKKNPEMVVLTGLKMGKQLKKWLKGQKIQEAGWFQQFETEKNFSIAYTPTRHWSKRGLTDDNKTLWGGFFIKSANTSIYFMGDSGFSPLFYDIFNAFGSPQYCIMGVGAFKPEWFMHQAHMSPTDAVKAFEILQGKYFIPMHFATYDLSDEPRMEPLDILKSIDWKDKKLINPVLGTNLLSSF